MSCDLLVEAAKSLPGGFEHEVVAVEWKSETSTGISEKGIEH